MTLKQSILLKLITAIGKDATEKLIAGFGGTRISASTHAAEFTALLGADAASALSVLFGDNYLDIPKSGMTDDEARRRAVELRREGYKINDIALIIGRNRRTVFRALSKRIAPPSTIPTMTDS